jgi:hypothetical protein
MSAAARNWWQHQVQRLSCCRQPPPPARLCQPPQQQQQQVVVVVHPTWKWVEAALAPATASWQQVAAPGRHPGYARCRAGCGGLSAWLSSGKPG